MRKIYLAEDSNLQAMVYKRALQRISDVIVSHFDDGLEVYLAVFRDPPDLLILDVMLPTLSGAAALRLLKFDRVMGAIPILIMSALTEEDMEHKAMEMRADGYLGKPIKPELLTTTVESLLAKVSAK